MTSSRTARDEVGASAGDRRDQPRLGLRVPALAGRPRSSTDVGPRWGWAPLAALTGALFAAAAAGAYAVLLAGITVVVELLSLRDREPGVEHFSSSASDAFVAGLLVLVVASVYGALLAVPLGAALGVLNGALARWLRAPRWAVVAVVAVVVGTTTGLFLPSAFVSDADWSVLAVGIGVMAAVVSGLHLRREQRRAVRLDPGPGASRPQHPPAVGPPGRSGPEH
ncbi:hypothetical protein GCM10009616_40100 [Microlunatus lacustris]